MGRQWAVADVKPTSQSTWAQSPNFSKASQTVTAEAATLNREAPENETVGGPVDVAVVTKGDGICLDQA